MPSHRIFADTLLGRPSRGLFAAVEAKSFLPPLVASALAGLLFATALVPRLDLARSVSDRLDASPDAAQLTLHDREVALEQAEKLSAVFAYASAVLAPALRALGAALALGIAFRIAAARPSYRGLLSVSSWGFLPLALKDLCTLPALLRSRVVEPAAVAALLPSNPSLLLPPGTPPPLVAALQAVDLFSLWALALVVVGSAEVAGVSTRRAAAVVAFAWAAWVLVVRVALPVLLGGRPG